MLSTGIHHVSINVDDVPSAARFYLDVLELEPIERPDLGFPGAWLRAGEQEVHLLGIQSGKPPREQHFAFLVTDLDEVIRRLRARDLKISEPMVIDGVCRQAFTHDPSGNMLEFNERL